MAEEDVLDQHDLVGLAELVRNGELTPADLLDPTLRVPVPHLGVLDPTDLAAMAVHGAEMISFTVIGNATGLPAASVPAGFDESGLPVGIQLMGRMGSEDELLRLARQIERAAPWPWQAPFPPAG